MKRKRGGIQLSFGMIFSIIIIIAIVGVAFYAIKHFLNLQKCTEISLFYDDLQKNIDRAWSSEITVEDYESKLPGSIDSVCFGDVAAGSGKEALALRRYRSQGGNIFLYPPENACGHVFKEIKHVDLSALSSSFVCFPTRSGKVSFGLEKRSFDTLVKITE